MRKESHGFAGQGPAGPTGMPSVTRTRESVRVGNVRFGSSDSGSKSDHRGSMSEHFAENYYWRILEVVTIL